MSTFSPTNETRRGPRGIPVSPMSYQRIEVAAKQVRSVFKVAPPDPLPALDIFERLSCFSVGDIPCEYGIRKLGNLVLGQTSYDPVARAAIGKLSVYGDAVIRLLVRLRDGREVCIKGTEQDDADRKWLYKVGRKLCAPTPPRGDISIAWIDT